MKKIFLLSVFCLALVVASRSQNLVSQNPTLYVVGYTDDTLASHVDIVNTGGSALDVLVQRVGNNLAANHESYFCWGQYCYSPGQSLSPYAETIPAGGTNSTFIGYLDPKFFVGISNVTYCYYDQANIQDSVCIEYTYDVMPVGLNDVSAPATFLADPVPNPARGMTMLSYRFDRPVPGSRLVMRTMTGRVVADRPVSGRQGALVIQTGGLSPGMYSVALQDGARVLAVRRLVVVSD